MVGGAAVGDADDVEAGAFGGEGAGGGIFEGDRFVAAEAELVEDALVEVGRGFRRGGVAAAGEEFEMMKKVEPREVGLDPFVFRVRGEADAELAGAGGVEEFGDAGENGLLEEQTVFVDAALELEGRAIGAWAETVPRIERVVGVADAADEKRFVEGHAMGEVNEAVGFDERPLGVDDEAVEVEDEGANHGSFRRYRMARSSILRGAVNASRRVARDRASDSGGMQQAPHFEPGVFGFDADFDEEIDEGVETVAAKLSEFGAVAAIVATEGEGGAAKAVAQEEDERPGVGIFALEEPGGLENRRGARDEIVDLREASLAARADERKDVVGADNQALIRGGSGNGSVVVHG